MINADLIGFIAAICTTVCFLPQLIKAWKTKSTKDISLAMFLILTFGVLMWLAYGFLINSMPVIAANAFTFIIAVGILLLKIKYG